MTALLLVSFRAGNAPDAQDTAGLQGDFERYDHIVTVPRRRWSPACAHIAGAVGACGMNEEAGNSVTGLLLP